MNTTKSVPTDSQQKITVESQIIYALWQQGRAYAGFEAHFEVKTLLVGDGGKVKATLYTEKGKKLGKVEGVMVLNRWKGRIVIPEKVKPDDFVYLEVELPKHRLSIDSNSIPVRPPIEVSSMKWSKVEVHRDEEVAMSCIFTNGVEEGDEVTVIVYEYDNDGNHDPVVKIPTVIKNNKVELNWKYIYQEDTDDIPTEEELRKYGKKYNPPEYFFMVMVDTIPVGSKQESGLLEFKDYVEIDLGIDSGFAVADKTVTVTFADGTTKDEKLDDKGYVKISDTPPGPYKVELKDAGSATMVKSKGGAGAGAGSGGGKGGSRGNGSTGTAGAGSNSGSGTDDATGKSSTDGGSTEKKAGEDENDNFSKTESDKFNIEKAIDYLNKNAVPPYGKGRCAKHVRLGILAGGIDITPHPVPAKEYGPYLEKYGFIEVSAVGYQPQKGDIIVMQSYEGAKSIYGHIEMYNGSEWVSDFKQDNLYPSRAYKANDAKYKIYRWNGK